MFMHNAHVILCMYEIYVHMYKTSSFCKGLDLNSLSLYEVCSCKKSVWSIRSVVNYYADMLHITIIIMCSFCPPKCTECIDL